MNSLIFDIETVGADFDSLDETTKKVLTKWIEHDFEDELAYRESLADLKNRLGFSPLTGEAVAIGVLDFERNQGAVYFQAPDHRPADFEEDGIKFQAMSEKDMLSKFWDVSRQYQEFVSFNGRGFDVPFLMIRSAIHKVRPSKNLMSNRYLDRQHQNASHIDLSDQLTFQGAVRRKDSLHLWTRGFGVESPKAGGVTGEDVGRLFKEGKYVDIAKYNVGDLRATRELYAIWQSYLRF